MPKRKNKTRNPKVDYLVYLGVRMFAMLIHMFSVRTNYVTARLIGDLMYRFYGRGRRRAVEHIRRSFPDMPEARVQQIARQTLRDMVYLGVEVLFTTRLITPKTWRRHIRLHNMDEALRLLLRRESGMIFLTGHYGNWEVVGYTMAALGFPNTAIARRLDNPYLNEYILGVRQNRGMRVLDKQGASAEIPDLLEAKGAVSFIADQDAGRRGLFVDFFGRKASTYKSIALLAMSHEVPVVVGYGRRLDEAFHFEIGIADIIHPADWEKEDDPMAYITQRYTKVLEDVIRAAPEQYLWVHRRWKHRPKGEPEATKDGVA